MRTIVIKCVFVSVCCASATTESEGRKRPWELQHSSAAARIASAYDILSSIKVVNLHENYIGYIYKYVRVYVRYGEIKSIRIYIA